MEWYGERTEPTHTLSEAVLTLIYYEYNQLMYKISQKVLPEHFQQSLNITQE